MTQHLTPTDALPQRPRLLPGLELLERENGEIQIGLDPRLGVVAGDLPAEVIQVLRDLDGTRSTHSILTAVPAEQTELLRELLTGLAELGLVEEMRPGRPGSRRVTEPELWSLRAGASRAAIRERRAQSTVAIHGNGRLAVALATLLATAGVGHLCIETNGQVLEEDLGTGFLQSEIGMPRRRALAEVVRRANPDVQTTRMTGERRPELALLTDTVVPAPELVGELVGDALPHLPVRVRDGTGIVGPLVFPGRSSCLRCADLHRASLDPSWPRVASQLAGRPQLAELTSVQAAASLAASQVLRVLAPGSGRPPVWNATLEIDSFAGWISHRAWPPHPTCGCGADTFGG